jgi:hypothetical protein
VLKFGGRVELPMSVKNRCVIGPILKLITSDCASKYVFISKVVPVNSHCTASQMKMSELYRAGLPRAPIMLVVSVFDQGSVLVCANE